MSLDEVLSVQLRDAMRAGDVIRRETIRQLRAALHNDVIARGREISDDEAFTIVQRSINQHRDSIAEFTRGGRLDLVDREQAELEILLGYMPTQLGRAEIETVVRAAIAAVQASGSGAIGPGDKGKVMRELAPQLRGKADMRVVNEVVQELLG